MTRLGFVIDQRKCIGCHACTVACKAENGVPLGEFRTWVKYVDKGTFPDSRRHFLVERCNHCDDAPCITICPTKALFRRDDGIVDFDADRCIGCKSCMQACPYDAIYIDPTTHTAAKCNFCAHRVDVGLQPACVNVCPEQAIITGDLDDPTSHISRLIARNSVQVRRPDQGTKPKLFYLGADASVLVPELTDEPESFLWGQVRPHDPALHQPMARPGMMLQPLSLAQETPGDRRQATGDRRTEPLTPAAYRLSPDLGPAATPPGATFPGLGAPTVSYNAAHPKMWGWKVSAYLWTKSIGAGAFLILALALLFGITSDRPLFGWAAPLVALAFVGATLVLLVWDLKRPERFVYVLLKSNFRSWLVWGAYILSAYSALLVLWMIGQLTGVGPLLSVVAVLGTIAAVCSAAYTGFLFGQAEGRDFWQSPLLAPHLVVQAGAAGAAIMTLGAAILGASHVASLLCARALFGFVLTNALLVAMELTSPHVNLHVRKAVHLLTHGALSRRFWSQVVLAGLLLPLVLAGLTVFAGASLWFAAAAGVLTLAGLYVYEDLYVTAGQAVPIS
jgi:Fe-S-cluster-containing dehydrogenase component/formate-dependent nitrite reductase membrane component NrfD